MTGLTIPTERIPSTALLLTVVGLLGLFVAGLMLFNGATAAPSQPAPSDAELRVLMTDVRPIDLNLPTNQPKIELGRALFFDKALSGDQNISCATCHHPRLASADERAFSAGTGGSGLGRARILGADRPHIPRNAPEIFNRGSAEWRTMFWDGRIGIENYVTDSPAEHNLPTDLDSALAVQAMFPVLSQAEMRGAFTFDDDQVKLDTPGRVDGVQPVEEWSRMMDRLLVYDEYVTMFQAAYPDAESFDITHAANALAAFEIAAFSFDDAPFDRYVAGDDGALSAEQKRGAALFYGDAGCSQCHGGTLLTDQESHNIGVPQFGPGKANPAGRDFGRFLETEDPADYFAFRTPPLRNVALTAPYMHNGAFATLEAAVRHHLDVHGSLATYDTRQIDRELRDTVKLTPRALEPFLATLDPLVATTQSLTDAQVDDLLAFLNALTSPSARDMAHLIPERVPSGLPVED